MTAPARDSQPGSVQPGCTCPIRNGNTYHQRATCTDPLVAALGWYADPSTQAAAYHDDREADNDGYGPAPEPERL